MRQKGPYREKLTTNAKQRYLEKLADIKNVDPYEVPAAVNYLVFGIIYYTMQEFKSLKSLESYETFCCGWVHNLVI